MFFSVASRLRLLQLSLRLVIKCSEINHRLEIHYDRYLKPSL